MSRWGTGLGVGLTVAVVVSPVVVGAVSLVGDAWLPLNDWSSLVFRVSQVGTRATPLVGPYSVHGWAHPGPLVFWLAAPLYRLTGGDPRSLVWTAAIVNSIALAALGGVAWRRGRWPLLLATMTLAALLVHGLGPEVVDDLWNPYAPLLPFLLTVFLVWDAALGRRRALVEAVLPASFAAQTHVAFVPLVVLLALWLVAWRRLGPREADGDGDRGGWTGTARWALVLAGVLWVGPLLDAVFDLHNPVGLLRTAGGNRVARIGPVDAVGVVARYVRPDGPWTGGAEPTSAGSVVGSGPLPLLVALGVLVGCLVVARRRGLVDVAALASLTLVLTVGAVPATSRIILPSVDYLTQWLSVIGGLVWFSVGWTVWRVTEPHLTTVPQRRRVVAGLAAAGLVGATALAWPAATTWTPARTELRPVVDELRAEYAAELPRTGRYRVEVREDRSHSMRGLVYWLIHDGYDVVTSDGADGLKWGHPHRWDRGDGHDTLLVLAVHDPGSYTDAYANCAAYPGARLVAGYDGLTRVEREWLDDLHLRRLTDLDQVSDAELQRGERLDARDLRVGLFAAPRPCSPDNEP